jgi:hypothetical protein
MEMMLWNVVLSAIVGVMVFMLKGKFDELQRISILLNKTREEKPHQSLVNLLVVPKMKVMLVKLRLVQLKKLK